MKYLRLYLTDIVYLHYFDFKGRTGRKTFWLYTLNIFLLSLLVLFIAGTTVSTIFSLLILSPSLSIMGRRLQDINVSSWWILLYCIPFFGALVLFVMACIKGTDGENKYGLEENFLSENIIE